MHIVMQAWISEHCGEIKFTRTQMISHLVGFSPLCTPFYPCQAPLKTNSSFINSSIWVLNCNLPLIENVES